MDIALAGGIDHLFRLVGIYGHRFFTQDVLAAPGCLHCLLAVKMNRRSDVDSLDRIVRQVISYESQARTVLLRDARAVTEDKIWRAYGLLRYARSLSFEELMNLLSGVRLGASQKLLPGLRVYPLNKIMIFTQPAHLEEAAGRALPPTECDLHRAAYVRRILSTEGVVAPDGEDPSDPPSAASDT